MRAERKAALSTIAMPRCPSYLASTAKSINRRGGLPSVASIGRKAFMAMRRV
jgi:hypothetical protein